MKSFLNALLILIAILSTVSHFIYLYSMNERYFFIGITLFVLWVILLCIERNIPVFDNIVKRYCCV